MVLKIGSVVIRCYEFERMVAFWQEALHYVPREPSDGSWVILRDPEGKGPNISLQRVSERRSGKRSRLHLDLYTLMCGPTRRRWLRKVNRHWALERHQGLDGGGCCGRDEGGPAIVAYTLELKRHTIPAHA